jgi:hypothetical protein
MLHYPPVENSILVAGGKGGRGGHSGSLNSSGSRMDESRVDFKVQYLGPAITPVMRIWYLKWLS